MRKFGRTTKLSDLGSRSLTYGARGATRPEGRHWVEAPVGFRRSETTAYVGRGPSSWAAVSAEILRWAVKTRSGFDVEADGPVSVGQRLWVRARFGPVTILEPVEVVAVVDEPTRVGFAYGTLEGHPVSGEEAFVVDRDDQDRVWFTLRSLTRAAPTGGWRTLFPALLVAQRLYRRRYRRSLRT